MFWHASVLPSVCPQEGYPYPIMLCNIFQNAMGQPGGGVPCQVQPGGEGVPCQVQPGGVPWPGGGTLAGGGGGTWLTCMRAVPFTFRKKVTEKPSVNHIGSSTNYQLWKKTRILLYYQAVDSSFMKLWHSWISHDLSVARHFSVTSCVRASTWSFLK